MYIHTDKEITRIALGSTSGALRVVYKPSVTSITAMCVVNNSQIIVTGWQGVSSFTCKTYKYNQGTGTNKFLAKVPYWPIHITLARTAEGPRFVIIPPWTQQRQQQNPSGVAHHGIGIYNSQFELLAEITDATLGQPQASTVSDSGTLLVTDQVNNRISEFNLDGSFVHHLLTAEHGISCPLGLSYSRPYLWITDRSDCGLALHRASSVNVHRARRSCPPPPSPPPAAESNNIKCFQIAE